MQRDTQNDIARTERLIARLETTISDHIAWLKTIHCALMFGEGAGISPPPEVPVAMEGATEIDEADFARLRNRHQELERRAQALFGAPGRRQRTGKPAYVAFMDALEAYGREARSIECRLRQRQAETDPLTGIRNRRGMMEELRREWTRAMRTGQPCCVALLDLDHFKHINDTFGHQAGDEVLCAAARFIRKRIRSYDLLYRYGGEEFLLCLPATTIETAHRLLDRLRVQMARQPARLPDGRKITATVSIGIAAMQPDSSADAAIADADHAVYEAKELGRDRVCIKDPDEVPMSRAAWAEEAMGAGRG